MGSPNEDKCCEAVLQILEQRHGAMRRALIKDTATTPGIEVLCSVGLQSYAIEHTLIEPFPDTKGDDIAFARVFLGIEDDLRAWLLPDSVYQVWVDVYAFRSMRTRELAAARQQLIGWVRSAIPQLGMPVGNERRTIRGALPSSEIRVLVTRMRTKVPGGRLLAGRFAPPELEHLRIERLRYAFEAKNPKLEAARRAGRCSVLIIESADVALTNQTLVGEAVEKLLPSVDFMPHEIFFIDTAAADEYYVYQLMRDGEIFPRVPPALGHWEFFASDLRR